MGIRDIYSGSEIRTSLDFIWEFVTYSGSEIRTSLDFKWSKKGWVANGLDFEWDLKSRTAFDSFRK